MLEKKQKHCQLVPVQSLNSLLGINLGVQPCIYIPIQTHTLLGIIDSSVSERISVFRHPSTKDGWNLKSTQHKHFHTRTWSPIIMDKINGFAVSRILFILRKTHFLILLSPSFIYLFSGCYCCLFKKCIFKWIFNPQCSLRSWICDIFHFSGKRIRYQDKYTTANSWQQ